MSAGGPALRAGLWDRRIARARSLARASSPASAILTFSAEVAEFQKQIAPDRDLPSLVDAAHAAAPSVADFLDWLQAHAPTPLAGAAAEGRERPKQEWRALLLQRIEAGQIDEEGPVAFIVEALLQPFAEKVRPVLTTDATYARRCPVCASAPVVAVLREEGQGARRSLVCALCFHEWDFLRVQCPSCEENRFDALPVYTADAPAHVRIDACDSCRTYVKAIDLTRDGLAVPTVDDLASLPLDLWARERGYRRLYPNLLRI